MAHVVSKPTPPFRSRSGAFEVHQIPAASDNLVWLMVCKQSGACAVVDGPDAQGALRHAAQHDLRITTVLNTHTHGDHIGVNLDLARRGQLGAMQVIGPDEARDEVPGLTHGVRHGDSVQVGAVSGSVITANGHIHGHVCFLFEDVLFAGDALFAGGCGRVFTGDFAASYEGLARLKALAPETRVCCAHEYTEDNLAFARSVEPDNRALIERQERVRAVRAEGGCAVPSTLAEELATNPMLRWDSPSLIAEVRAQSGNPALSTPLEVFTATRKLKDSGRYKRT
jgi:hydroxyacylglutathione hydrolase